MLSDLNLVNYIEGYMEVTCKLKVMPMNLGLFVAGWFIYPDNFAKKTSDIVRYYYRYNDGQVSWDLLVNKLEYNTDNEPIDIGHLLNPSEEELFQYSCTMEHDVDEIAKLMSIIDKHKITKPDEQYKIPRTLQVQI